MRDIVSGIDKQLDVIFGEYKDQEAVSNFVQAARTADLRGTLYIGYPVLMVDDEKIEFDAVLVSRNRGVIVFDLYSLGADNNSGLDEETKARQEKLYVALFNRLNSFSELRSGRNLFIKISTVTIHPIAETAKQGNENIISGLECLDDLEFLAENLWPDDTQIEHLNAAIQRISNLKPKKKRANVALPDSKGAKIREIEKKVANLDLWQKRGSIEYVNGPQRIRGLAGSGKTVVLALKAAYLHVKRPDWDIVVTFNTISLYQQFESLITRFVYSQISDEPDWEKLHIMHAWGASDRTGVYKEYSGRTNSVYRSFGTAASLFGYDEAFKGACDEALKGTGGVELQMYDMMLIDEAQDLPNSFFQLAYRMVKKPKRIVWAYDDLQNLSDVQLPSANDLFGLKDNGSPRVSLKNSHDRPLEDIVLPCCYRNPPWTLLSAHGIGFGVHREPMAQMYTDPSIWKRLGYISTKNEINFDQDVEIERSPDSIPSFFPELLKPCETLVGKSFDSNREQYDWVAETIKDLISRDELEHEDILIVLPDVRYSKSYGAKILDTLMRKKIHGHIPGQTSSRDELFRKNSIAITHIYRAKGNESPVVFILNSEFSENPCGIKQRRNILFTAMTRSRAWTYILGVGDRMDQLLSELKKIENDRFRLKFHYPSREVASQMAVSIDGLYEEDVSVFAELERAFEKVEKEGDANSISSQLKENLKKRLENLRGTLEE